MNRFLFSLAAAIVCSIGLGFQLAYGNAVWSVVETVCVIANLYFVVVRFAEAQGRTQ